MDIIEVIRTFFGAAFVLFVPGFAWSYIFFARKNIDWIERLALSFGLSIAVVPISIFWLNWLFQMKVTLLSTLITICGLTALPIAYILVKRSTWGSNATSWLKSALRHVKGKTHQN